MITDAQVQAAIEALGSQPFTGSLPETVRAMLEAADQAAMTSDEMKAAEKRGYAKGYAAGQKRAVRTNEEQRQYRARLRFEQQVFCAAIQGLIAVGGWESEGMRWRLMPDFVQGAWRFANEASKQRGDFA